MHLPLSVGLTTAREFLAHLCGCQDICLCLRVSYFMDRWPVQGVPNPHGKGLKMYKGKINA